MRLRLLAAFPLLLAALVSGPVAVTELASSQSAPASSDVALPMLTPSTPDYVFVPYKRP
jgi:hypothetical protein